MVRQVNPSAGAENLITRATKRIRLQSPPTCPVHAVPMFVGSSQRAFRYCYCPVPGCRESAKQARLREHEGVLLAADGRLVRPLDQQQPLEPLPDSLLRDRGEIAGG